MLAVCACQLDVIAVLSIFHCMHCYAAIRNAILELYRYIFSNFFRVKSQAASQGVKKYDSSAAARSETVSFVN